jgi:hypothetical protein
MSGTGDSHAGLIVSRTPHLDGGSHDRDRDFAGESRNDRRDRLTSRTPRDNRKAAQ